MDWSFLTKADHAITWISDLKNSVGHHDLLSPFLIKLHGLPLMLMGEIYAASSVPAADIGVKWDIQSY